MSAIGYSSDVILCLCDVHMGAFEDAAYEFLALDIRQHTFGYRRYRA